MSVKDIEINISNSATSISRVLDKDDNEINLNLDNNYTKLSDVPKHLINAFISIEDKNFYNHKGLNYKRIVKAAINNVINGSYVEGASTISQQLIKNKYLTNEKSISRKIKEAYLTKKLEKSYSKDQILEAYINTIYYGNGAYGIGNASKRFFGKEPKLLSLNESCMLAGIVKSPSRYSPINNIQKSTERKNLILKEMYKDKYISKEELDLSMNEDVDLNVIENSSIDKIDLYTKNAIIEASKILNITPEEVIHRGYIIKTYRDKELQEELDKIINNEKYYQKNSKGNIADSLSMVIDNKTFGISAIAGRSKYDLINFKRQPGSLIKPVLVYTPALEKGIIYPCSHILDEKITINNYTPQNVGDVYYGYVSIRDAVAKSLNTPVVRLCNEIGIEECKKFAKNCGLEFNDNDVGLSIALGGLTDGYRLKEITDSYIPFVNNGNYRKSSFLKSIINSYGKEVYVNKRSSTNYCSANTAYLMTETMINAVKNGTSKKLSGFGFDIAGKTGTVNIKNSNHNTDAYSLAYTSSHIMSTWLGNYSMQDDYYLEGNNNGGTFATEIIKDMFNYIYKDNKPNNFIKPETIVELPIDTITLGEKHIVTIANNLPERYTRYEIFSDNHIPSNSNIINTIQDVDFEVVNKNNRVKISFNAKDYIEYKIYRKDYIGNVKLIKTINNTKGLQTLIDEIEFNKNYNYFINYKYLFDKKSYNTKTLPIYINKDYAKVLEKYNNDAFVFS